MSVMNVIFDIVYFSKKNNKNASKKTKKIFFFSILGRQELTLLLSISLHNGKLGLT